MSCIILLFEVKDSSDYLGPDVSSPVMDSGHYGQYLSEAIVLDLSGHLAGSRELVSECGHKIIKTTVTDLAAAHWEVRLSHEAVD